MEGYPYGTWAQNLLPSTKWTTISNGWINSLLNEHTPSGNVVLFFLSKPEYINWIFQKNISVNGPNRKWRSAMTDRSKYKKKRSKKSKNSSSSSTNSEATPKRIKEAPSMSTASVGEDSVFVHSPVSEPPTTLPSDPLSSANMADQVEMTQTEIPSLPTPHAHSPPPSIADIGTLLDNKLGLFRLDLLNEVKAVVKTELRQVTDKLKEEIDELRGTVHDIHWKTRHLTTNLSKFAVNGR